MEIEVRFLDGQAELLAAAPIWAKAAFTEKRKRQVQDLVEGILRSARLIAPREPA